MKTKATTLIFTLTLLLLLNPVLIFAQIDRKTSSYGKADLDYSTDAVYLGRKDSVAFPYITPTLGYHSKSGFYADGSFSLLTLAQETRVDLFALEAGYEFRAGKKFSGSVAFDHFFFNSQSASVRSEINNTLIVDGSYETNVLGFFGSLGFNFSPVTDFLTTAGINHQFSALDDALNIIPTVALNAGTNNFYKQYYTNKKYAVRRRRNGTVIPTTVTFLSSTSYQLQDYEFSLPLEYSVGKFIFHANPVYAIPVNPVKVKVNNNMFIEKLNSTFFADVGVTFVF
jgi:hypothetical protein